MQLWHLITSHLQIYGWISFSTRTREKRGLSRLLLLPQTGQIQIQINTKEVRSPPELLRLCQAGQISRDQALITSTKTKALVEISYNVNRLIRSSRRSLSPHLKADYLDTENTLLLCKPRLVVLRYLSMLGVYINIIHY